MPVQYVVVVVWNVSLFYTIHTKCAPEPVEYIFDNEHDAMCAYDEIKHNKNKTFYALSVRAYKRMLLAD